MEPLPINTISIEGWRSIKNVEVTLGKINILLGANGSGKSSFLSAFELLRAIGNNNLQQYIEKNGGANQNFHYGTKKTADIKIAIKFGQKSYQCNIIPGNNDNVIIGDTALGRKYSEKLRYETGEEPASDYLEDSEQYYSLDPLKQEIANSLASLIIYHFQDTGNTSPLKRVSDIYQTRYLHPDGDNLAAYLYEIKNNCPKNYDSIITAIQFAFPDFKDFIFQKTGENVRLLWNDKYAEHYDFPLSALSDGTLRFIALSTLLLQPNPPKFIIIDEPELGLHPEAIGILAELIKLASANSQLLISTQSVQLVNCFTPEDLLITEKEHGETKITRPDTEELKDWLKDYTLGEIWRKNIMGGNP